MECTLNDIAFRGSLGYFVGSKEQAYKTTDGGNNWEYEKISSFPPNEYIEFNEIDTTKNMIYVLCGGAGSLYSISKGADWIEHHIYPTQNICFFNDSTGYYSVGYDAPTGSGDPFINMRKTDDYGQNWEAGFCFDPTKMYIENESIDFGDMLYPDIKVVNDTLGYAIFGQYFYRMPGQEYILTKVQSHDEPYISIYQSGNMLHIGSRQKTIVSAEFFDVSGRSVLRSHHACNKYEVMLNDRTLPNGILFIKCTFSDQSNAIVKWDKGTIKYFV